MRAIVKTPLERYKACEEIRKTELDRAYVLEWKPWRRRRSTSANGLYWMWLACISEERHGSRGDAKYFHQYFMKRFLTPAIRVIDGEEVAVFSSRGRDTKEFSEYMESVFLWAMDNNITLPKPGDQGLEEFEAMYGGEAA